ncbi:MAG: lipopolysaccharide heptosyltransferase II [Vicinamibacterales bacterium]|nr:lipopolysaccharide heptosyltransferase II [Vicinamibacterales bacterium]
MTVVAFAPNWLGDAVMALPALADVRRHIPRDRLLVAARSSVAALYDLVPGLDGVIPLATTRGLASTVRAMQADARAVRGAGASTAILFPNSMRVAATAMLAGVPERWGYNRDMRRLLLTRGVGRASRSTHQVDAYRHLVSTLGVTTGPREPVLDLPGPQIDDARAWLAGLGWDTGRQLVGLAPGAAYGGAKRWPPERVAQVAADLVRVHGATCVVVGSAADADTAARVVNGAVAMAGEPARAHVIDVAGRTTLTRLAGVLSACRVFVSNDSGAMHLAAALGTPLVALFGPTNEHVTGPVARPGSTASVIVGRAWCRPCGLRECPLDHRCMRNIPADRVLQAVSEQL